jgi:isopenicillin-N N-acyltransferase-like protein
MWVSEGPHLLGRFIRFDLARILDGRFPPSEAEPVRAIPCDAALTDGRYAAWLAAGAKHPGISK